MHTKGKCGRGDNVERQAAGARVEKAARACEVCTVHGRALPHEGKGINLKTTTEQLQAFSGCLRGFIALCEFEM